MKALRADGVGARNRHAQDLRRRARHFGWDKLPKAATAAEMSAYLLDRRQQRFGRRLWASTAISPPLCIRPSSAVRYQIEARMRRGRIRCPWRSTAPASRSTGWRRRRLKRRAKRPGLVHFVAVRFIELRPPRPSAGLRDPPRPALLRRAGERARAGHGDAARRPRRPGRARRAWIMPAAPSSPRSAIEARPNARSLLGDDYLPRRGRRRRATRCRGDLLERLTSASPLRPASSPRRGGGAWLSAPAPPRRPPSLCLFSSPPPPPLFFLFFSLSPRE